VLYHVPTHVRTRLDRQRNYFRIYMISHALISDSVPPLLRLAVLRSLPVEVQLNAGIKKT